MNTTPKTIRRNQIKTIMEALQKCVVISQYKYDDMDTNTNKGTVTPETVMELAGRFDRVYAKYSETGDMMEIHVGIHQNHFYTGYISMEYAKTVMTDTAFAKYFPEAAAAERAQAEAERAAAAAIWRAQNAARMDTLITTEAQPVVAYGQRVIAKFASLNKNCTLGEYIEHCAKPEFGEKEWDRTQWVKHPNWRALEGKIEKIVTLTPEQYDIFVRSLMDDQSDLFAGFEGGTRSDYDPGRDIQEFWQMTEAEQAAWKAQSYSLVMWVQAPGRASFVVDPQGYNYVRYAGIYPTVLGK